jgi:hypothetical protein
MIAGMGNFIWESDHTYISWGIFVVYLIGSFILGSIARKQHILIKNPDIEFHDEYAKIFREKKYFGTVDYCIDTLTSLGLLGTVTGLIIMVVGAFAGLDVSNQDSVKEALVAMSSGVGTALITTLVGLSMAILLRFNLMVTKGG